MKVLILLLTIWWQPQNAISTLLNAPFFVSGQDLEGGARHGSASEADDILEGKALDLSGAISDFGGLLA